MHIFFIEKANAEGIVTCSADSVPHTHTITDTSLWSDLVIHFVGYNSGSFLQFSITQWPNPQGHLQNNKKKVMHWSLKVFEL